jgi:hypothetical protein
MRPPATFQRLQDAATLSQKITNLLISTDHLKAIHAPGGLYVPSTDKDGLSGYAVVPESATGISFGGSTLHLSAFDPVIKPAPQRRPNRDISTSP